MNKSINIFLVVIVNLLYLQPGQNAFADFINQNHFNTTFAGETQLMPKILFGELNSNFKKFKSESTSYEDVGFTYMYGVGEETSIGTNLVWRQTDYDKYSVNSLTDPEFFVYSKSSINSDIQLYYGSQITFSPEKGSKNNHYTGGPSLSGYFGVQQFLKGSHSLVGNTSIQIFGDRESDNNKHTGGHLVQIHGGYELSKSSLTIGSTLGFNKFLRNKYQWNDGTISTSNGAGYIVGNLYSSFLLSENIKLIPSLKYFENLDKREVAKLRFFNFTTSLGFTY